MKLLINVFWFFTISIFSQTDYSLSTIPESLLENTNSVVRDEVLEIIVHSQNSLEVKNRRVVTVLNSKGMLDLDAYEHYNTDIRIASLKAVVYDKNGKQIKKIGKSQFRDYSAISNGQLYTDDRVKGLYYSPEEFPVTIEYTSVIKSQSTMLLPYWYVYGNYEQSIENAEFKFINLSGISYRKKELNFDNDINFESVENGFVYSVSNRKSIKHEEGSPELYEISPGVKVSLNEFNLSGISGKAINWKEFGEWSYINLLSGRDELSKETINKISKLVENAESNREKIKRIYNYVQDNTRYVGVQLGIGGYQPIAAKEVDDVKYGDCKGLTNYTKALLASQGIESYYSIVYAGNDKRNIDKSFTSMQGNHVILCVPEEKDSIWLECTNQRIPFGFLGDFTDDRDVLIVNGEQSQIVRTPKYSEKDNTMETRAEITVDDYGKMTANVSIKTKGLQYDDRFVIENMGADDSEEFYKEYWGYLNDLKILKKTNTNDKDLVEFVENLSVSLEGYARQLNDKILLAPNAFNRLERIPKKYSDRKLPFKISRSYSDYDEFIIKFPEKFKPEDLPEKTMITTQFGTYEMQIQLRETNTLVYKRKLTIVEGEYTAASYKEYRKFIREIVRKDKSKIILTTK